MGGYRAIGIRARIGRVSREGVFRQESSRPPRARFPLDDDLISSSDDA